MGDQCVDLWCAVIALAVHDYAKKTAVKYQHDDTDTSKSARARQARMRVDMVAHETAKKFLFSTKKEWAEWRHYVCEMVGIDESYLRRISRDARKKEEARVLVESKRDQMEVP